jgi:hypothetical protein
MSTHTIPLTLSLISEPDTKAEGELVDHGIAARAGRASLALLGLWAIAGVCIFIPGAHFVLVPGFLLAGLIAAAIRFGQDHSLVEVVGVCPRCKVQRHFGNAGRFRDGGAIHCNACGSQLEVHVAR